MRRLLVLAAACSAPVAYDATIFWNATEVPDPQSVRFDGREIQPGFAFSDTFDSIDTPITHEVEATTRDGVQTFELVPTRCGEACDHGSIDCAALTAEREQWIFFHGILAFQPPDPLEFTADEGSYTAGGMQLGWTD